MPEKDPCQSWLEEFRKEVDTVLSGSGPAIPALSKAQADFSAWWESNLSFSDPKKPQIPPREHRAEIDELTRQKAVLDSELARVKRENARLHRNQAAFKPALQELESTIARARAYKKGETGGSGHCQRRCSSLSTSQKFSMCDLPASKNVLPPCALTKRKQAFV